MKSKKDFKNSVIRFWAIFFFTTVIAINLNSCKKEEQTMTSEEQKIHDKLIKNGFKIMTREEVKEFDAKNLKPFKMSEAEIKKVIYGIVTDTITKNSGKGNKMNVEPDPKTLTFYGQTPFSEGPSDGYIVLYLDYKKGPDGGWVPKRSDLRIYEPNSTSDIYSIIEMLSVSVNYYDGNILSFKCGAKQTVRVLNKSYSKNLIITAGSSQCCKLDLAVTNN